MLQRMGSRVPVSVAVAHGLSLVAASRGYSPVPVDRILIAVASLVVEYRL